MKKILFAGIALLAVMAVLLFIKLPHKSTLPALLRQYAAAKTATERSQCVEALIDYYRDLTIPDMVTRRVAVALDSLVANLKIDPVADLQLPPATTSPFALESRVVSLLQKAQLARLQNQGSSAKQLLEIAAVVAARVDSQTQNTSWSTFTERVGRFDLNEARAWLQADLARGFCSQLVRSDNRFADAERYGSLALRFLQTADDARIRLEVLQRLQHILYHFRSLNELSIALAEKALPEAERSKNHLRACSFIYDQAEALKGLGQIQGALGKYDDLGRKIQEYSQVPGIGWFTVPLLLGKGRVYLELGEIEKALEVGNEVEKVTTSNSNRIRLRLLRSDIFKSAGSYERAEAEVRDGIALAEASRDTFNLIIARNSLGALFERLGEYDLALTHYNQAHSLFGGENRHVDTQMMLFNNIADILVIKNDLARFEAVTREATKLVALTNIPTRRAELLRNIGNMQKRGGKYSDGLANLEQAANIYAADGILRYELGTKLDMVDCQIGLKRFATAKRLLAEIEALASRMNYIERVIDAKNRLAEVQFRQGEVAAAMATADEFLPEIEHLSSQFENRDRLMAYRQKIYDILKNTVRYEIALHRPEAAFARLDHAKGYALKSQLLNSTENKAATTPGGNLIVDTFRQNLDDRALVVDYMLSADSLYVFMVDHSGLQLLSRPIESEGLRRTVHAYNEAITATIQLFRRYDAKKLDAHFARTVKIGQQLYDALLGWPALQSNLQNTRHLYIIPDEFLFELPFATLISGLPDSQVFVIDRTALETLPSASFLQPPQPAYRAANGGSTGRVLVSVDRRFPGAEKFITQMQSVFASVDEMIFDTDSVTTTQILARLQGDFQAYIFVGHGESNPIFPERAYIELSVKTPDNADGKIIRLSLADLQKIDWLDTELVMLVGCETASGKLYRGTGISSLLQGFLTLGAQEVIGNLWEVDAAQAIAQAQAFLTQWAKHHNPSQALRDAEIAAIRDLRHNNYYKAPHPYFWGSAVLLTAKNNPNPF